MKNKSLTKIKFCISLILGVFMVISSFLAYRGNLKEVYELTFLSNFLTGIFFIVTSIFIACRKNVPEILYLVPTVLLLLVNCVSIVMGYSFKSWFLFMHCLNPVMVMFYYLIFTNQSDTKWYKIFYVMILPLCYLVFALIFGNVTGNYIYSFLDFNTYGKSKTVFFVCGIAIFIIGISVLLFYLNKLIHKSKSSDSAQDKAK